MMEAQIACAGSKPLQKYQGKTVSYIKGRVFICEVCGALSYLLLLKRAVKVFGECSTVHLAYLFSVSSSIYELSNVKPANLGLGTSGVKDQLITLFQH